MITSHYSFLWTPIITNKTLPNLYRDARFILDVYRNPGQFSLPPARLCRDWLVSLDPSQEYQQRGIPQPQSKQSVNRQKVWESLSYILYPHLCLAVLSTWYEMTNERLRKIPSSQWEDLMSCHPSSSVSDANLDIIFIRLGCPGVMLSKERVKRCFKKYPPGKCDDNRLKSLCSRWI